MRARLSSPVLFLSLFIVFLYSIADAGSLLTEDQAASILISRVKKDNLYSSWTTQSCLSFIHEGKTNDHFDIAVREKHGGKCPGDPDTFPIVDRFRINRSTKKIRWYDPIEDGWRPYKDVLESRPEKQDPRRK
jgi:hypothetical protein